MPQSNPVRFPTANALLALFLVVLAARLFLVAAYGSSLPFADEWDAGAATLYKPYLTGELDLAHLLAAHNEHRFLTSRLLGLAEFEIAGGWNPRFQMIVNAMLFAGFAAWFTALLLPLVPVGRRIAVVIVAALIFALPIDTEITLMGMNAHFYLMIIFSLLALRAFTRARALGVRWWLGALSCALAYLSMASAALTPLVAATVIGMQLLVGARKPSWAEFVGLALLVAGTLLALYFTPDIPGNRPYHAQSVQGFLDALVAVSGMPLVTPLGGLIVQAPLFVLLWRTLRGRAAQLDPAWMGVGVAGWMAAQMLAIAYSRAAVPLSPRYLDIALVGLPLSAAVLLQIAGDGRAMRAMAAGWLLVVTAAATGGSYFSTLQMARSQADKLTREQPMVTDFLRSGDAAPLLAAGKSLLVYPDPQVLVSDLSDPVIRSIIPADIWPDGPGFDRQKLLLNGNFKGKIDKLVAALPIIAGIVAALAAGVLAMAVARMSFAATTAGDGPKKEAPEGASLNSTAV